VGKIVVSQLIDGIDVPHLLNSLVNVLELAKH